MNRLLYHRNEKPDILTVLFPALNEKTISTRIGAKRNTNRRVRQIADEALFFFFTV